MGTIVYINLIELLLEEGDKTEKEIFDEAINRFGFPEQNMYEIRLQLKLKMNECYFQKQENGKYHLLELSRGFFGRKNFLEMLSKNMPKDYFENRPHIKKLKEALEKKVLQNENTQT